MEDSALIRYGKFLSSLISSVVLGTALPSPFEGLDWKKLFYLAKKQGVAVMVYPVVKKMNLPEDAMLLFEKNKHRMVARTTRQNIEAETVMSMLEANSIRYIRLKGSHIKRMYPFDYLRTFTDVDLCISESDREKARPVMESLGYTISNITDYHDEYEKDKFFIFELHSHIISPVASYSSVFDSPFTKAVPVEGSEYCYELNNEYLYLHLFFHLYKHFTATGCGIRLFADLLVYENYIDNPDWNFIESVIKEHNMFSFYITVKKLIRYFFYGEPFDKNIVAIAEYIFKNEPTGLYQHHVASLGFWGKIKYFLKNWFPSAKDLAFRYPVLEKAPVLLPVCWLRRIFYSLFFNRSAFKEQAESIRTASSEEYKLIKQIRQTAENPK